MKNKKEEEKKKKEKKKHMNNKMTIKIYLSAITLNANGLNASIKRQMEAKWIQNKTFVYAMYKRFTSDGNTYTV